jgi:hypothetical protein
LSEVRNTVAFAVSICADIVACVAGLFPFDLGSVVLDVGEEESKLLTANFGNVLRGGIVDFTAERGEVREGLEDVAEFDVGLAEPVMPVSLTHDAGDHLDIEGPFRFGVKATPGVRRGPCSLVNCGVIRSCGFT